MRILVPGPLQRLRPDLVPPAPNLVGLTLPRRRVDAFFFARGGRNLVGYEEVSDLLVFTGEDLHSAAFN